jgi:general secretion pathway protein G
MPKNIPNDAWGNAYVYRYPGEHGDYDLFSLGADAQEGGEGENADIVNWE